MLTFTRWLLSVMLLIVMAALFFTAIKNLEYIYIDIPYVAQFRVMTAVALASAFFIGALIASLFFGLWLMQSHMKCRALRRELRKLKKTIKAELAKVKPADPNLGLDQFATSPDQAAKPSIATDFKNWWKI